MSCGRCPVRRLVVGALVVLCGPASLVAGEPEIGSALDLDQVVALALSQNPGFRAESARREEVQGAVEETAADAWPQVDLVASWNRSRNPSLLNSPDFEDFIDQFPDFTPGEQELWGLAVEVSQPIYSGGKVRAAVDLAELVVDITDAQIDSSRLDLALEAAEAYFEALKAQRALQSLESQAAARSSALKVVNDRFELGEATRLEVLRAQAAVAELDPAVAEASGEVTIRSQSLASILGLDDPPELVDVAAAEPVVPAPPPVEHLLTVAQDLRPELKDLTLQGEALDRQSIVTRAESRPQVDLTGSYGRQVRLLEDLEEDLFADWRVTVGMKWSLFDGGRVKGQLAQIAAQKQQLTWRKDELRRRILFEIQQHRALYETSRRRLAAARPAAQAAAEAARVAEESYRLGVALQADLLDAQDRALRQELVADTAFYDALSAKARLYRAVGRVPRSDVSFAFDSSAPTRPPEDSPR